MGKLARDETLKEIAAELSILASDKMATALDSWPTIMSIARAGNASKVFNPGDIITEKWTDGAAAKDYDMDWRIIDRTQQFEDQDGNLINGLFLESKWTTPFGVQFSHQRAFYACPDGLAAGTYHLDFAQNWGSNMKTGVAYQFTLTKDVPKGGRLAGFYGGPDTAPSTWRVYSYGADGITISETVNVTAGSAGTNLGTMPYQTRNGNMNSMQETSYGWNRWSKSALRQWLNSDADKGGWWTPQDQWDIAPDQLATNEGFLKGIPDDMLNAIRRVKVITYANTVQDGGVQDVTYDKVFPLALEQLYISPLISGEGAATEYYKELNGTTTKWALWNIYPILRRYGVENHANAQYLRLRSAYRGYARYTFNVYPGGDVNYYGLASYALRCAPACVIG